MRTPGTAGVGLLPATGPTAAALLVAGLLGAQVAAAQDRVRDEPRPHDSTREQLPPDDPIRWADRLYFGGDPESALRVLEGRIANDPDDYAALWRAARAAVLVGIEQDTPELQDAWVEPALSFAERAVAQCPEGTDGRYWHGVAAGRRAMNAPPGRAVDLTQQVYDDAHAVLAVDSLHAGAHNLLGKLNYEIMSLSRVKRAFARAFMGNQALHDASWERAEWHLERAVQLSPDVVLFQFDAAALYLKRNRPEAAIAALRATLQVAPVHPLDHRLQARARELLAELEAPVELRSAR